jgi:hypothetical protein
MVAGNPGPVVPERYVKALAGEDPIESQRKAPKRIKKLLRGLSEKELARRPAEGKWSIKEVIAHLADGEVILGARIRFVAAMERPQILGYDQDAFVDRLGIERVKTSELFEAFAAVRSANVCLMQRLADDAWSRIGLHTERGEESIATMIVMYAGHDRIHEDQIEAIRATLKAKKSAPRDAAKLDKQDKQDKPAKLGKLGKPEKLSKPEKLAKKLKSKQAKQLKKAEKRAQKEQLPAAVR